MQKKTTLKEAMRASVQAIIQECQKFHPPSSSQTNKLNQAKIDTTINIICMRAMEFRREHSFGFIGIISFIKMLRHQLKLTQYQKAFVDNATLSLVQALMRMPKKA